MALVNVDPEKADDKFYRYKMPRIQIKVEGNGNGIKTVVCNITEIAEKLGRNVEYPMKFFAHELAVNSKFKDDKWILTGFLTQEKLQVAVFEFVKKFVLCKACRNPETILSVDEKKNVLLTCKACARVTTVDPMEKLCNLFIKQEMVQSLDSKGKKKEKKKEKSKDEKEEERFDKATRGVTDADVIHDSVKPGELPNPVVVLREFIRTAPPPTDTEVTSKIWDLKGDYGLDDRGIVCLVFEALFDAPEFAEFTAQVKAGAKLLRRFVKPETQKEVIVNIMLLCADVATLRPKFPMILKLFYDHHVVEDEAIFAWHTGKSAKGIDKELQKAFREKSGPFVEWLRQADDEDEEEEESEEETRPAAATAVAHDNDDDDDDDDVDVDDI